ncbi:MAG: hypothetical protein Q8O67_21450 [Deltaproteobacteria bacterium]|nr:hypothetical protein [Deltaproteobacteria bacterium]
MLVALLSLALVSAPSAPAARREKRADQELCCLLCGAWAGLLALTCPPCTWCAQPLFGVVGATGGECFKGTGACDADDVVAPCVGCLSPTNAADEEPVPEPAEPPPAERDGALAAMHY